MRMNQKQLEKALSLIETYQGNLPDKAKATKAYVAMFESECPELREFVGMRLAEPLTILSRKNLDGLSLAGRTLKGVDFSSSSMRGVNMSGCALSQCNLTSVDLEGADISETSLLSCAINKASFRRANLRQSLIVCDFELLRGVEEYASNDFSYASLELARLENLYLVACNFSFTYAACTDFAMSCFESCDMRTAYTMGATWEECYVSQSFWREGTEPTEEDGAVDHWSR